MEGRWRAAWKRGGSGVRRLQIATFMYLHCTTADQREENRMKTGDYSRVQTVEAWDFINKIKIGKMQRLGSSN